MFCSFCGKSIAQGEAYCDGCAGKARSNRPEGEKQAELSKVKTDLRKKQKAEQILRDIGKREIIRLAILVILASIVFHIIYIFVFSASLGGEALIDLGLFLALAKLISVRGRVKLVMALRCLGAGTFMLFFAFSNLLEMPIYFAIVLLCAAVNFLASLFIMISLKIKHYFELSLAENSSKKS